MNGLRAAEQSKTVSSFAHARRRSRFDHEFIADFARKVFYMHFKARKGYCIVNLA